MSITRNPWVETICRFPNKNQFANRLRWDFVCFKGDSLFEKNFVLAVNRLSGADTNRDTGKKKNCSTSRKQQLSQEPLEDVTLLNGGRLSAIDFSHVYESVQNAARRIGDQDRRLDNQKCGLTPACGHRWKGVTWR